MSFVISLNEGSLREIQKGTYPKPKPFLQIIKLQKIQSLESKFNTDRFKLILSDGVTYTQALLSPKLNHLIYLNRVGQFGIVKLIEYDTHKVHEKPILVILSMEEIIPSLSAIIGSPVSLEKFTGNATQYQKKSQEKILNTLSTDFLHLFNNPELSDIKFTLDNGQAFHAHRNILASRCPYYRSLFLNGMKESRERELRVDGMETQIFLNIMKFIYSDQVSLSAEIAIDDIWNLYTAAKYYCLDRLMRICELFIIDEKLNCDTCCSIWNTAYQLEAPQVSEACKKFFEQNFEKISTTEEFTQLTYDLLLTGVQSDNLVVSSASMITDAVARWAKENGMERLEGLSQDKLSQRKRKWEPSSNVEEIKQSIVDIISQATSCPLSVLFETLKDRYSQNDIRNACYLLQVSGHIYTVTVGDVDLFHVSPTPKKGSFHWSTRSNEGNPSSPSDDSIMRHSSLVPTIVNIKRRKIINSSHAAFVRVG